MKAWRLFATAVLMATCLSLAGCLVVFDQPLPTSDKAPAEMLGSWSSKNAWGEALELEISRVGPNHYKAVSFRKGDRKHRDEFDFTVARHGSRWYLCATLPEPYGARYAVAGFEISKPGDVDELVVYGLDAERIQQLVDQNTLAGQTLETDKGEGILVTSPLDRVFAYLDDPANSDVFLKAARYQRMPQ